LQNSAWDNEVYQVAQEQVRREYEVGIIVVVVVVVVVVIIIIIIIIINPAVPL
jgi:hypothetical protein